MFPQVEQELSISNDEDKGQHDDDILEWIIFGDSDKKWYSNLQREGLWCSYFAGEKIWVMQQKRKAYQIDYNGTLYSSFKMSTTGCSIKNKYGCFSKTYCSNPLHLSEIFCDVIMWYKINNLERSNEQIGLTIEDVGFPLRPLCL